MRLAAALPACLLAAACALPPPSPIVHQPISARAGAPARPVDAGDGAIYHAGERYRPLFEDIRARNVGDTLTVVISENTSANKRGSSNIDRGAELAAQVGPMSRVPGKTFQNMSLAASSSNSFDASGATANSNAFAGSIAVTVIEVHANGNLLVSGEKQIAISDGTEFIRFSGVVNPRTISVVNSVSSTQIADARIEYKGTGALSESQRMGWLARFFMTILPF